MANIKKEYSELFIDNGNGRWDDGEEYEDENENGIFDEGESFTDSQPGNSAQYNFKTSYNVSYGDEIKLDSIDIVINGIEFKDTTLTDVFKIVKIAYPIKNFDLEQDGVTQLICTVMGGQMDIEKILSCGPFYFC